MEKTIYKKSFIRRIDKNLSWTIVFDANTKVGDIIYKSPHFGELELDSFSYGHFRKKVRGTDKVLTIVVEVVAIKQIIRVHKGQVDRRTFVPLQYDIVDSQVELR